KGVRMLGWGKSVQEGLEAAAGFVSLRAEVLLVPLLDALPDCLRGRLFDLELRKHVVECGRARRRRPFRASRWTFVAGDERRELDECVRLEIVSRDAGKRLTPRTFRQRSGEVGAHLAERRGARVLLRRRRVGRVQ